MRYSYIGLNCHIAGEFKWLGELLSASGEPIPITTRFTLGPGTSVAQGQLLVLW